MDFFVVNALEDSREMAHTVFAGQNRGVEAAGPGAEGAASELFINGGINPKPDKVVDGLGFLDVFARSIEKGSFP